MLSLDRVGKTYPNGVHALGGVSFEVALSEIVAVIGGSGCGKSTLLRAIAGLDPASEGTIALDGEIISAPHQKVGIIFQEPRLLPWLRVADNVGFGLGDCPRVERARRVAAALVRVDALQRIKQPLGRASCRAVRRNASPPRGRWCRGPKCCCSTNCFRRSMPLPAPRFRTICSTFGPMPNQR